MSDIEQRIRERAYQIWLEEGCPEGRELDHWNMATKLVAIEDGQQSTLKPIDENPPQLVRRSSRSKRCATPAPDLVPSSGGASFKVEGRARPVDHRREPCSLGVTQRIFERGENRLNGVDALTESLQLPLLGVEAAKRSQTVLGGTRATNPPVAG